MKIGDEVRFIFPGKYDDRVHRILHILAEKGIFLHYWAWVDEDELILVEDKMKEKEVKVGNQYRWNNPPYDVATITKVEGENVFFTCDSDNYKSKTTIKGIIREDWNLIGVIENTRQEPLQKSAITPSHYNSTKSLRYNEGKLDWSQVDFKSLEPMVRGLMYGESKYSSKNWQNEMEKDNPLNSAMRHLTALFNGEEIDEESQVSHAGLVMCNMMFYIYHFSKDEGESK